MVGPTVRYEVGLDLEADGNPFEVSTPKPAIRPSMGCEDEEISWGFEIPEDELDNVWVIASWMTADNARPTHGGNRCAGRHAGNLRVEMGSRLAHLGEPVTGASVDARRLRPAPRQGWARWSWGDAPGRGRAPRLAADGPEQE